ncbi:hypothetical protein XA68_11254 [Ophiocordyceps unilateralis]|uniref:Uncharacterized protein n=1 Tax=Ophiocordyceps unilateralis TaxID=268505 RepID=A0A2A9P292_OPHUN|nr:hypothetical protein XA68_11254 [Ophiocordyceps unilateralis]
MRRGYLALQGRLHPDSLFFLGDLFDGGREWKTHQGRFVDPHWGIRRPEREQKRLAKWHRKYGEKYWLGEYRRFSDIFFRPWNVGGAAPGPWQRGRKLVASLPGNHDLGFGAQVQVPVRDRFGAFFGDVNRVDVVGNHTIVSVDTVSLSADSSKYKDGHDLRPIYGPVHDFLDHVQTAKRKAARDELDVWYGVDRGQRFAHAVEDLNGADLSRFPAADDGAGGPDWPTILLTHVPLYREPGTPCGPRRERWPPTKPRRGQTGPVVPDHGNAISVAAGYQYQNVLSEEDSLRLVGSVGNITHVFSGDDHDYCELVHGEARGRVRETTVKSFSMAMGVSTPGFVMASLWNPVGADGKPIPGSPPTTMQTHLCLMPNQLRTYAMYAALAALSLVILSARALLMPVLRLTPFALEPETTTTTTTTVLLPVRSATGKAKAEPPVRRPAASATTATERNGSSRWSSRKGRRWTGVDYDYYYDDDYYHKSGPRITLDRDFYDGGKAWKRARNRTALGTIWRELWTTVWRVAWMTGLVWLYLAMKG